MAGSYRLTPRMLQNLENSLRKYHDLFSGGRCTGWELEELVVKAIKADTQANHHVKWKEGGHDFKEDIHVAINGESHSLQIKSGTIKNNYLTLSGNRLGRYSGDLHKITSFLRNKKDHIISIPCEKIDNEKGRIYNYQLTYIDVDFIKGIDPKKWEQKGTQWIQKNAKEVEFSLRPNMSWQIWWKIPVSLLEIKNLSVYK